MDGLDRHRRPRDRVDGLDGAGRAPSRLGLVGSVVWVASAQLLLRSMDRAARDTARLAQLQRAASAWQASQVGRQRERRVQVQQALAVAGPVLARTVSSGGELSADDRLEARLAEGRLRDEMRGPRLLDDDVRTELERARRRGANVTVLDEGGLDGLDEESLAIIRAQLADTLRSASSDRLYIRTSPHETVAVTVVGRSAAGAGWSDEDAVDLWREIAHPRRRLSAPRRQISLPVPAGEGSQGGERNRRRRGAAKPPAPRLADGYPKTVRVAEPGVSVRAVSRSAERRSVPAVQVCKGGPRCRL